MERSDPSLIETVAQPDPVASLSISSSSYADEGRFIAGTLLAGRYRILGLLGRGGMGEVYRATDLMVGQSVALKFLPEEAARDQRLLERFHGEVRVARQVSHPNVCRVYDIGQIDGMPFISMEYVDGEDLSSLLTRIGRLPADKALETARKLCAGLAAAHDRGVIHRDLKPQNIMMNKRGEVVIMDFGLAAVAAQLTGQESRNGTPAYMSPEQLKGAEVTQRSDVYALGLVLYELFTGKKPYEARNVRQLLDLQESAQLTSMTSIAADVDPSVEKVIRRCLEPDPARRPASPLSVAAALPGGDPLAEALAAGEMPSPELVAASGKVEGLDRKYSIPLLVVTLACLFSSIAFNTHKAAVLNAPLDVPPAALEQKAREFAVSFGYAARPVDSAIWIEKRRRLIAGLAELPEPRKWNEWLTFESPIQAVIRESPAHMIAKPDGEVTAENPPPTLPGMAEINVDGGGRMIGFQAVPMSRDGIEPTDPAVAFRAAGLDMSKFTEKSPDYFDRFAHDKVMAWSGPHPVIPGLKVEVQVAWWKGRITLVHTNLKFPGGEPKVGQGSAQPWYLQLLSAVAIGCGVFFGVLLARKNWVRNRCDRKGALRLAWFVLIRGVLVWFATLHVVPTSDLINLFFGAASWWLLEALVVWLLYLALEPAVRARWPHSIVSWNRLLAGKWKDAHVGSHVLIGAAIGVVLWVAITSIDAALTPRNTLTEDVNLWAAVGTRHWIAANAMQIGSSLLVGLIGFFVIFGLRVLLRKDITAAIVAALLFTATRSDIFDENNLAVMLVVWVVLYAALIFTLLRFGLVATIAAAFFIDSIQYITISTARVTWATPSGVATLVWLAAIAIFAFWRSLGARELIVSEGRDLVS
ncbi:MAG TPA: serine/threonine-protein kinase [Bryobacteraceae bacterium]